MTRVFVSDCEGPITKNDHAFEVTSHFVPNGDKLFSTISRYDDVLADVLKKPRHAAGTTLKLILPFLKAYGVTDEKMREQATKCLMLIPGVKETLSHIQTLTASYVVSTSFEHYIRVLCRTVDFPYENTYCTRVNLDNYDLTVEDKNRLKQIAQEISQISMPEIDLDMETEKDLSADVRNAVNRLDEVFNGEIMKMTAGDIYRKVKPVGGSGKAEAIKDIVRRERVNLADVVYFGDSITDVEAFRTVREDGGLTVSFNGNEHAVKSAEIAVLSRNSVPMAIIAEIFAKHGRLDTLSLVRGWSRRTLEKKHTAQSIIEGLYEPSIESAKVKIITAENMKSLAEESTRFRKSVRGEAIGGLG